MKKRLKRPKKNQSPNQKLKLKRPKLRKNLMNLSPKPRNRLKKNPRRKKVSLVFSQAEMTIKKNLILMNKENQHKMATQYQMSKQKKSLLRSLRRKRLRQKLTEANRMHNLKRTPILQNRMV